MDIELKETASKGIAYIVEDDKILAQMTYSIASSELII
jgi:hypothetical protein